MFNVVDPFTRTPGIAGKAYIDMHYKDIVINSFENPESSKYIYKIVGLRGSGKSVEYSQILGHFQKKDKWLVYSLSSAGNPIKTLISKLSKEPFIDNRLHSTTKNSEISSSGKIKIIEASGKVGVSYSSEENMNYYSDEATMAEMIGKVQKKKINILVGIDDISRTPEMVQFLSIWGSLLLEGYRNIYLVCTGLYQNIEEFTEDKNLTFFKRSDSVEIKSLNQYDTAYMYQKLLNIDEKEAVELSRFVKGYAYAYQVMGSLYFNKNVDQKMEDLIPSFRHIIFKDSYDLIWKTLTEAEKNLVRIIVNTESKKVSDIKEKMENPNSYSVLRSRLENKHILSTSEWGKVRIDLPEFKEFVNLWG